MAASCRFDIGEEVFIPHLQLTGTIAKRMGFLDSVNYLIRSGSKVYLVNQLEIRGVKNTCPVCQKEITIKDGHVTPHFFGTEICYWSFVPYSGIDCKN